MKSFNLIVGKAKLEMLTPKALVGTIMPLLIRVLFGTCTYCNKKDSGNQTLKPFLVIFSLVYFSHSVHNIRITTYY